MSLKRIRLSSNEKSHSRFPKRVMVAILSGSIDPAIRGQQPLETPEGPEMKQAKLTTKQKRDRRWKIKRRRIRKQKYGM